MPQIVPPQAIKLKRTALSFDSTGRVGITTPLFFIPEGLDFTRFSGISLLATFRVFFVASASGHQAIKLPGCFDLFVGV